MAHQDWTTTTVPPTGTSETRHVTTRHAMKVDVTRSGYGSVMVAISATSISGYKVSVYSHQPARITDAEVKALALALADELHAAGFVGLDGPKVVEREAVPA